MRESIRPVEEGGYTCENSRSDGNVESGKESVEWISANKETVNDLNDGSNNEETDEYVNQLDL